MDVTQSSQFLSAIKLKRGEQKALKLLDETVKKSLVPLIEVVPVPAGDQGVTQSLVDQHFDAAACQIGDCWGAEHPVMLDFSLVQSDVRAPGGMHPIEGTIEQFSERGVRVIPVIPFGAAVSHMSATGTATLSYSEGCCIRVGPTDSTSMALGNGLIQFTRQLGVPLSLVDVIFDLRDMPQNLPAETLRTLVVRTLGSIRNLSDFRRVFLLSGAFPADLRGVEDMDLISRADWRLFESVTQWVGDVVLFGDYGPRHPALPELNFSVIKPAASLRYCLDNTWLIPRGKSLRDVRNGGYGQYNYLCRNLRNDPRFCGAAFSAGDARIDDAAAGGKSGNLETWVTAGLNHHITYVARQVANRVSP